MVMVKTSCNGRTKHKYWCAPVQVIHECEQDFFNVWYKKSMLSTSAWHSISNIEPEPQPAEFSGPIWAVARPQAKNRAGRTRPLSCRTWPHPYVPTSLLENWTARTRTGFLVPRLRVIRYERRNKRAAAGRSHDKRAAAGRNCGRPRLCGRLRPTGPDVMHCCLPYYINIHRERRWLKVKQGRILI